MFFLQANQQDADVGNVSKVPEGHHPRGTTLCEGLQGNLPLRGVLRGLCGGLLEGSAGLCRVLWGSIGFSEGSDRMLVICGTVGGVAIITEDEHYQRNLQQPLYK